MQARVVREVLDEQRPAVGGDAARNPVTRRDRDRLKDRGVRPVRLLDPKRAVGAVEKHQRGLARSGEQNRFLEDGFDDLLPRQQGREPLADAVGALELAGAPRQVLAQQRVAEREGGHVAKRGEQRGLRLAQRGVDHAEHPEGVLAGEEREDDE